MLGWQAGALPAVSLRWRQRPAPGPLVPHRCRVGCDQCAGTPSDVFAAGGLRGARRYDGFRTDGLVPGRARDGLDTPAHLVTDHLGANSFEAGKRALRPGRVHVRTTAAMGRGDAGPAFIRAGPAATRGGKGGCACSGRASKTDRHIDLWRQPARALCGGRRGKAYGCVGGRGGRRFQGAENRGQADHPAGAGRDAHRPANIRPTSRRVGECTKCPHPRDKRAGRVAPGNSIRPREVQGLCPMRQAVP